MCSFFTFFPDHLSLPPVHNPSSIDPPTCSPKHYRACQTVIFLCLDAVALPDIVWYTPSELTGLLYVPPSFITCCCCYFLFLASSVTQSSPAGDKGRLFCAFDILHSCDFFSPFFCRFFFFCGDIVHLCDLFCLSFLSLQVVCFEVT